MFEACLATRAHYLDVTGEIDVFALAASFGERARKAGVMLLPGIGFDVVPSDCLAAHVAARVGRPQAACASRSPPAARPRTAPRRPPSRRSATQLRVRRGGKLVALPSGSLSRSFDFGQGPVACVGVPMGDVVTAAQSTGADDVEVYMRGSGALRFALRASQWLGPIVSSGPVQRALGRWIDRLPEGPSEEERLTTRARVVAEAESDGRVARARLETPSGYETTRLAGVEAARRILAGEAKPGFQTPATAFGADFVLALPGVKREDLDVESGDPIPKEMPMSEPAAPSVDVLTQMMLQNAPKTPLEMRSMLDGFAPFLNAGLPEVGAFHEAVPVREGVTADVVVPRGAGPHRCSSICTAAAGSAAARRRTRSSATASPRPATWCSTWTTGSRPSTRSRRPFDDCLAAVRWAHREAARFGGDPERLAIGGDSAGGNLSAAVAAALAGDPARPKAALLIYGVFDFAMFGDFSLLAGADAQAAAIGRDMVEMMTGAYLGKTRSDALLRDPRVSPLARRREAAAEPRRGRQRRCARRAVRGAGEGAGRGRRPARALRRRRHAARLRADGDAARGAPRDRAHAAFLRKHV